jgi:hypothetical protein
MPHSVASLLALVLAGAMTVVSAGCGEEDAQLLPGGTAREITANLDSVQQLSDEGDCLGAESAALQVSEQVEALDDVDPNLKQALREGASRLNEVVAGCEEELETTAADEATSELEPDEDEKEAERESDEREEEEEKEEKEQEKEESESEKEAEEEEEPPLPPPAEGEGKGLGDEGTSPGNSGEGGSPSGGVSPSSPVEGGE